jgi:hypothetical protein
LELRWPRTLSGLVLGAWSLELCHRASLTLGHLALGLFQSRAFATRYDNSSSRAIYHPPLKKNLSSGSSGSIGSTYFSKKMHFFHFFALPTALEHHHLRNPLSPSFLGLAHL